MLPMEEPVWFDSTHAETVTVSKDLPTIVGLGKQLYARNPRFLQLLEEARQRVRVTGGVSLAEFRRRLDDSAV